jgi:hypothetical protein
VSVGKCGLETAWCCDKIKFILNFLAKITQIIIKIILYKNINNHNPALVCNMVSERKYKESSSVYISENNVRRQRNGVTSCLDGDSET